MTGNTKISVALGREINSTFQKTAATGILPLRVLYELRTQTELKIFQISLDLVFYYQQFSTLIKNISNFETENEKTRNICEQ